MKPIRKIILTLAILSVFSSGSFGQEYSNAGPQSNCEAYFTYSENPTEPYTFEFSDLSTGIIDEWMWSVDDSTFSYEQNPEYSFPGQGSYEVCLTISNWDSVNFCYDKYCVTLAIIDSIECIADFSYILDSNSSTPNKYTFYDMSSGNPDHWFWDFGDGHTSTEQNPEHIFQQEGQYNVCLTVANGNFINCVDTVCKQVKMPDYFSFGGFAFAGDHPINNPVHSGDTGMALLYKIYPNDQVLLLDTNKFTDYGYYHFSNKLPGEYLVKIMLTPESTHFKNYMATYYPEEHFWKQAQHVSIGDSNAYNMHVHLRGIPGPVHGPGSISGKVVQEQLSPFERPYPPLLTEVVLADPDELPLDFTFCDQDGNFIFRNIAYGQYKLFVDHTGKYAQPVLIEIDEIKPYIDTLKITLSNHSLTTIGENASNASLEVGNVFPNPVADRINLEISTLNDTGITLQLLSVHGHNLIEQDEMLSSGNNRLTMPAGDLPRGVYILAIRIGKEYIISRKFIK
jgi:PKD repeat protein